MVFKILLDFFKYRKVQLLSAQSQKISLGCGSKTLFLSLSGTNSNVSKCLKNIFDGSEALISWHRKQRLDPNEVSCTF